MTNRELIDKISVGYLPNVDELASILSDDDNEYLFQKADEICKREFGDTIHIRAIIEFSNYCRRRCKYCGLNATNTSVPRYRMGVDDIVDTVIEASNVGYKTIVMQSGEDPWYTADILCDIITKIRAKSAIFITLSIGERPYDELERFKACGADRFLLKHETADAEIFEFLHPCVTQKSRIDCLKNIKALGYETGSGFMIGLPNQTYKTIASDILLLHELSCDMAGIGPFIPHPETPLKYNPSGDTTLTKKAVALTRLVLPKCHLPATTSLGIVASKAKDDVFSCGANVIMKKVTPWENREKYEIYPTNFGEKTSIKEDRVKLEKYIKSLGKSPN